MTAEILDRLAKVIADKKAMGDAGASYTASLLAEGMPQIARKLGEESVELMVAALSGTKEEVASESADMLYHWLVLLAAKGVDVNEVWALLEQRQGMSGLEEKASRKS